MPLSIQFFQRGGSTRHHLPLQRALEAMLRANCGPRLVETLRIRVEFRATKLEADTAAMVQLLTNGSKPQRSFRIVVQRDHTLDQQIGHLAHEVVHIQQSVSGRYQLRKVCGVTHVRWEGKNLGPLRDIPYATQPWEKEAFARQDAVAEIGRMAAVGATGTWTLLTARQAA
jgi:hypothetical protein